MPGATPPATRTPTPADRPSTPHAPATPSAISRAPLSPDDYLPARMISTPFCLFDCDVPCDGATAMIVSRADLARDLRRPPPRAEAVGPALPPTPAPHPPA